MGTYMYNGFLHRGGSDARLAAPWTHIAVVCEKLKFFAWILCHSISFSLEPRTKGEGARGEVRLRENHKG
jgi:hypothetical protein